MKCKCTFIKVVLSKLYINWHLLILLQAQKVVNLSLTYYLTTLALASNYKSCFREMSNIDSSFSSALVSTHCWAIQGSLFNTMNSIYGDLRGFHVHTHKAHSHCNRQYAHWVKGKLSSERMLRTSIWWNKCIGEGRVHPAHCPTRNVLVLDLYQANIF